MSIITWKEQYAVGIERIDREHRQLIALINEAYDAVRGPADESVLAELAGNLRSYALSHFRTEETLMQEHGYPQADSHVLEHDDFRWRMIATEEREPIVILEYLSRWLAEHILSKDNDLGLFLRERGVT